MGKKNERIWINTPEIVSNPTGKWSEFKKRAHTFDLGLRKSSFWESLKDRLWHMLSIRVR